MADVAKKQWGGSRPGAGRKKLPDSGNKPSTGRVVGPAAAKPFRVTLHDVERIIEASREVRRDNSGRNPFQLPKFPERAVPSDASLQMAMDESMAWGAAQWNAGTWNENIGGIGGLVGDGLLFPGYTYLSELAQRPEYRIISETIADDATREWIDFEITGSEQQQAEAEKKDPEGYAERMTDPDQRKKRLIAAGKMDKVKALKDDQERLRVRDSFYDIARNDGFFGRSHLFIDVGAALDGGEAELKTPIGDGRSAISKAKVGKDSLRSLKVIEPIWCYPTQYNSTNPLKSDWYNPQFWFVMGQQVHASRLPAFVGHPVPDILKPAYAFGGLSMTQVAQPYVDIWLRTRQSVADLIHSFSVMVLSTDMQTLLQSGSSADDLLARVMLFNAMRDNQGTYIINKDSEDFKNVLAALSGLEALQAQAQEHVAAIARIPLVKYTGMQPMGLNASSEGEIAVYDDTIAAYQNRFFRPKLTSVVNFQQLSLFGDIDPEITLVFNPLRVMTEKEKGERQKADAERDNIYVDMGAISNAEVRQRVIDDPELPYADLDPDDVPDLGEEEADGLEPKDGEPQPGAGGQEGAAEDGVIPFGRGAAALDAQWQESEHPRASNGQFGNGGAGAKLDPKSIKQVGPQMGSNPGGVFEDSAGKRYYVKQARSADHLANEMSAAALYRLTGSATLDYRPVKGGKYVATEMADLDKNNAHKLSPSEKAQAQRDFVAHAWLANHDAVGTGGDNLGTVDGKVIPLDFGGALSYRAQGAPKDDMFGDKVGEIDTMRDPAMAPDAARIYGDITDEQLRESADRVTSIPDAAIKSAVEENGGSAVLAQKLIARKRDIARRFDLMAADAFEESKHPRDKGGKFAETAGGGSAAGEQQVASSGKNLDPAAFKSKKDHVGHLLQHGTTSQEILQATGWPSVSVPQQAFAAGLKLEKYKENGVTKYKGVPFTPEEKAAAIAAMKEKKVSKTTPVPKAVPPDAPKEEIKATPQEIAKAKSSYPLGAGMVPFVNQSDLSEFNAKFAGQNAPKTDKEALAKIAAFKALQAKNEGAKFAATAKANEEAAAKKAAEKKAAEAQAEKNKEVMKTLGINEQEAFGFSALTKMMGGTDDFLSKFKKYEEEAKSLGYPITGFQCALIKNYTDGGYHAINKNLRSGTWTEAQHVYVKMVNKALLAMPRYEGTVRRGTELPAQEQQKYVVGNIVEERAFTSTSISSPFGGNTKFVVKAIGKRGASVKKLSVHKAEDEVVFAARTFFKVTKVEGKPGGDMTVHMEEMDD